MKKLLMISSLMLMFSQIAFGQESMISSTPLEITMGVRLGYPTISGPSSAIYNVATDPKQSGASLGAQLGVRTKYVGIEARYIRLQFASKFTGGMEVVQLLSGYGVYLKPRFELDIVTPYGLIGYSSLSNSVDINGSTASGFGKDVKGLSYGIGIGFAGDSMSLEYVKYGKDVSEFSFNVNWSL